MAIATDWVRYGEHLGYLAWPERAASPIPAVLVIQELWGVDAHIQDVTRRLAAAGYAALAPDLYAQSGQRPEVLSAERIAEVQVFLNSLPAAAWSDAAARQAALAEIPQPARSRIEESHGALFGQLGRLERWVPVLAAAARHLREGCPVSRGRKVASVGFCMGGALSALLACSDPDLAGAAIFYGSAPSAERVAAIRCPVIGFYGAKDQRLVAGLPAFTEAMSKAGKSFEPHVYEEAGHAFFNDTRPSYEVRAARNSFVRLMEFFGRTLGT